MCSNAVITLFLLQALAEIADPSISITPPGVIGVLEEPELTFASTLPGDITLTDDPLHLQDIISEDAVEDEPQSTTESPAATELPAATKSPVPSEPSSPSADIPAPSRPSLGLKWVTEAGEVTEFTGNQSFQLMHCLYEQTSLTHSDARVFFIQYLTLSCSK